jgi:inositol phosphorylceramide mannosyltransferase catalytic subunit
MPRILIPKVINRVWLGPAPVPKAFERYAETWRRHHPDWEVRLWRDHDLPPLSCQEEFDRVKSFKVKYDIVRLELLRQEGGVVMDMDVEALRPIDPLLDGVEAFVGQTTFSGRIGNQVLGAIPNHPLWEHAVRRLSDTVGVATTASQQAGPAFVSRMVKERPKGVHILPRDTFYSPLTIEPPERPHDFPEIYAVHHSTESYREGEEGEIIRLQRRLRDSQKEIHRLTAITSTRWWRLGVRLRRLGLNVRGLGQHVLKPAVRLRKLAGRAPTVKIRR